MGLIDWLPQHVRLLLAFSDVGGTLLPCRYPGDPVRC
jgi:hypothetical protein